MSKVSHNGPRKVVLGMFYRRGRIITLDFIDVEEVIRTLYKSLL
jgi:hypothetical protein